MQTGKNYYFDNKNPLWRQSQATQRVFCFPRQNGDTHIWTGADEYRILEEPDCPDSQPCRAPTAIDLGDTTV